MANPLSIQHCGSSHCADHIHSSSHEYKENKMDKAFRLVERVCAVALGAISALTSFWLFAPTFVFGVLVGVATHQKSGHSHHRVDGSCSVGFIEQITGVKLPRAIALTAGVAVLAAHIDHHASVFVPIVGVTLGIWAGKTAAPTVNLCFRKLASLVSKPAAAV